MEIDIIFKIAGLGIVIAVINQILSKAGRDDQAMMVNLAGVVVVLYWVLEYIAVLFNAISTIFNL